MASKFDAEVKGKVYVITGSSTGIGKAVSLLKDGRGKGSEEFGSGLWTRQSAVSGLESASNRQED